MGSQSLFFCSSLAHLGPQLLPPGASTSRGASAFLSSGPLNNPGSSPATVPMQMPKPSQVQQVLTGGTPKPEPEQVIRKYPKELKSPPDEDCIICMEKLSVASGYNDVTDSKTMGPLARAAMPFTCCAGWPCTATGTRTGACSALLQGRLWREDWDPAPGEDGGVQVPGVSPRPRGLRDDTHRLQHCSRHPGPRAPQPWKAIHRQRLPRQCYLPDHTQGCKVLELLKVPWKRRLICTVRTSSTMGETSTVVWNEIHHKTEMDHNMTGHGYPDPNYLPNLLTELATQGVTEDCLE